MQFVFNQKCMGLKIILMKLIKKYKESEILQSYQIYAFISFLGAYGKNVIFAYFSNLFT